MDKNIELYDDEIKLLNRIEELKKSGYEETDMYIISGEDQSLSMVRGMTEVIIKEDDESIWDRFKSFLSGDDSIVDAFNRMHISEDDRDFYYEQVRDGKILLYVDREYIQYYNLDEDGKFRPIIDPDIQVNLDKEEKPEVLREEEMSDTIKEDLGLTGNREPEEMRKKIRDELLMEEARNRLK